MADVIQFSCPECGKQMQLPAATAGRQGSCPACKKIVTIQPDPMDILDLGSMETPVSEPPATSAPAVVEPEIIEPQLVVAASTPVPVSILASAGKKKTIIYLAAGATGIIMLLVILLLFQGGDNRSPDSFGKRALAAIQARDPDQLSDLFVKHEDFMWLEERILKAIKDPLKKSQFKEGRGLPDEDKMKRWNIEWREDVIRFLTSIDDGDDELTFRQLKQATYLGIVGEIPRRTFDEEIGVSQDEVGIITMDEPVIFIGVHGRVYTIDFNEMLIYLNGHWRVSGDLGPRLSGGETEPIDLDEIEFDQLTPGAKKVMEKVNQYLVDTQDEVRPRSSGSTRSLGTKKSSEGPYASEVDTGMNMGNEAEDDFDEALEAEGFDPGPEGDFPDDADADGNEGS
jgi:hypothetical protein